MLQKEGLLSEERSELMLSWRHTGFSVHNRVRIDAGDMGGLERMSWDGADLTPWNRPASK